MTVGRENTTRAIKFLARHPDEALDRVRSKIEHVSDRRKQKSVSVSYVATPESERILHERLRVPFPCEVAGEFQRIWTDLGESFAESESYVGDWVHDADPGIGAISWCLVRHLRPQRVVETGVARGITSRILLEALERNGEGHLWSIDLPFLRTHWHDQTAAAVPVSLHPRWTYVRGSSRRRLPGLLAELGEIDVFVHDSAHTEANMRFEFETAWAALRPGGALVSHDIVLNAAFSEFAATVADEPLVAQHDAESGLVGILVRDS